MYPSFSKSSNLFERVKGVYGMPRSHVRRLFILEEEADPERTTVIFVNQAIGF